jgi:hypothetical protein
MSDVKTKPTAQRAEDFLSTIEPKEKREDSVALLDIFRRATGEKAIMWGTSIIGFGEYRVQSGAKENKWPVVAFSPRKQSLTLYLISKNEKYPDLLERLGKHTVSGSCLHIKRLSDVDPKILTALIKKSFLHYKKTLT